VPVNCPLKRSGPFPANPGGCAMLAKRAARVFRLVDGDVAVSRTPL